MRILSIDVGILHLGLVEAIISDTNILEKDEITLCELVDITELMNQCEDRECTLHHDKVICDYMTHFFKKFKLQFDLADVILIERQPLIGLCTIQDIIMFNYRDRSVLISPNAMLNFMGFLSFEYDIRKVKTVQFAEHYLSGFEQFVFNERKHDLADSLCIMYYYLHTERNKKEVIKNTHENSERVYSKMKNFIYQVT